MWWVKDQPNIIKALNCTDKTEQIKLLQEAVNWYSFYINNWNPIINNIGCEKNKFYYDENNIPQIDTNNKAPRNIKSEK